jgi:hypothetical protein
VDKPLTSPEEDLPKGLVDMEGAGFFEAASSFLPPHRIFCLKVISDFMDGVRLTKKQISALVSRHADEVARLVALAESLCTSEPPVLGSREQRWMERVTEALCPTVSQRRQLEAQVTAYVVCRATALPKLDRTLLETPLSKRERSERLEAIRRRLAV